MAGFNSPVLRALSGLAVAAVIATSAVAEDDRLRYASLVADVESGEVMHARYADSRRAPAELAQLLTLYVAMEAAASGALALDEALDGAGRLTGTALNALAQGPDAEAASALAQRLAGDEARFAMLASLKARALGLTRTRLIDAAGVDAPDQSITARDAARLALRLKADFPQYAGLVKAPTPEPLSALGAEALSVGYSRAAGHQIIALAERDGRRLIVVVLGGPSADERDEHAALLLERAFAAIAAEAEQSNAPLQLASVSVATTAARTLDAAPKVEAPPRRLRIIVEEADGQERARSASAPVSALVTAKPEPESEPEPKSEPAGGLVVAAAAIDEAKSADAAAMSQPREVEALAPPKPAPTTETPITEKPAAKDAVAETSAPQPSAPDAPTAPPPPSQRWAVQVGAYASDPLARGRLDALKSREAVRFGEAQTVVERIEREGRAVFRARFSGLTAGEAKAACEALAARGEGCFAVKLG